MANLPGYSAFCILIICNSAKVQSQTTSLLGSCMSSDKGATDASKDADKASPKSQGGSLRGYDALHVAALIQGQKLLREQLADSVLRVAADSNTSVSATRELLLTAVGALNRSLLRIAEELGVRLDSSRSVDLHAQLMTNVTADLEARISRNAVVQNRTLSQLDTTLGNSNQYMNRKFQELVSTMRESSLNTSSSEAAMLLRVNTLQSRIERASAESAGAINSLNYTLRSFVRASCQAEVSPVRQQLSQLQSTLQQARDDLTALRAAQESLRQSSRTQADLDALSTGLVQQVRSILSACPAGWTARGTSCYYFVSPLMVWEEAARACFALGATLVEIEDRSEDLFIKDFFTARGVAWAWIGLHDRSTEGQWHWTSGKLNAYRNWAPNEPSNSNNEDCAYAGIIQGSSYGWNDNPCNQVTAPSVCERPIS